MRLSTPLVVALSAVSVQADLTCLGLGIWNPIAGLVCHFRPSVPQKIANATVNAVKAGVEDVKELVKFDVTHNPLAIGYNYAKTATQDGISQANAEALATVKDFGGVTVGFSKEIANQAIAIDELLVNIFPMTRWNDISFCLIRGTADLYKKASAARKRDGVPTQETMKTMAAGCLGGKGTAPAKFTINGTTENVGSTIANLALLLAPVGAETEGVKLAEGTYDLAIPSSEDTTRILKLGEDGVSSEHFASEHEAQAVAEEMRKDPEWHGKNCKPCGNGVAPGARRLTRLGRRMDTTIPAVWGSCCNPPLVTAGSAGSQASDWWDLSQYGSDAEAVLEAEDAASGLHVLDEPLAAAPPIGAVVPPDLAPLALDATSVDEVFNSLDTLNAAPIKFSADLSTLEAQGGEQGLFKRFRAAFTEEFKDEFGRSLQVRGADGGWRLRTESSWYMAQNDPVLGVLQRFTTQAFEEAKGHLTALKGLTAEQRASLKGTMKWYWTAPSTEARAAVEVEDLKLSPSMMAFVADDVAGLQVDANGAILELPHFDFAMWGLKGYKYDFSAFMTKQIETFKPSRWAEGGAAVDKDGRLSMVLEIFEK